VTINNRPSYHPLPEAQVRALLSQADEEADSIALAHMRASRNGAAALLAAVCALDPDERAAVATVGHPSSVRAAAQRASRPSFDGYFPDELRAIATSDEYTRQERAAALAELELRAWKCDACGGVFHDTPAGFSEQDRAEGPLCDDCEALIARDRPHGLSGQDQAAYDAWASSRGVGGVSW
jgi:hypothetical protein